MDRSFLSDQAVVTASRRFVCARLATYEDSEESKLLKDLFATRSGELENSVFAILGPDGVTRLVRPGRSMRMGYRDAGTFAKALDAISSKHPGKPGENLKTLPLAASVPVALTVAAADTLPLVILPSSADPKMMDSLANLAWSPELVGKLQYAQSSGAKDLQGLKNRPADSADDILVVLPDEFAQGGEVSAILKAGQADSWAKTLQGVTSRHTVRAKSMREHLPEGRRKGVFYEPANPVTDPQERRARERNRPAKP
ncbi:MAG: hypothetical protein ACKO23_17895 [Gemmataceae bacterium]